MMRFVTKRERSEEIFEAVMDSVERICDMSVTSIMSEYQGRTVVDVRRMMCKIFKVLFDMSYQSIADLLNKNHATIIHHIHKHDDLYVCDKEYAHAYDELLLDVKQRSRAINYRPVRNGSIKLREIYSSEKEIFNVMMASFTSVTEVRDYLETNRIQEENVVYRGPTDKLPPHIAHELVFNDEKKYMEGIMRKSMDLYMTITDQPVERYYTDYTTGDCTIINDAMASYRSAVSMLGNRSLSLIYTKRPR